MVTIYAKSLTFNNCTFCPESVFVCFVWISEQTAIISLYNINWLLFIPETESVYCAVRTGCLYIIPVYLHFKRIKDHSINAPHWSPYTGWSSQKDKLAKSGNLQNSHAFSEIGEKSIRKYIHFSFRGITFMVHLKTLGVPQIIYSMRCWHY